MKSKSNDLGHIHRLIDLYFDANATEHEEKELRALLATTPLHSAKIDEARAVMGYFAAGRRALHKKSRNNSIWLRAATVALVVAFGVAVLTIHPADRTTNSCVAYVGQTEITDNAKVLEMMRSDIAEIRKASQSVKAEVASQISTLFNSSLQ